MSASVKRPPFETVKRRVSESHSFDRAAERCASRETPKTVRFVPKTTVTDVSKTMKLETAIATSRSLPAKASTSSANVATSRANAVGAELKVGASVGARENDGAGETLGAGLCSRTVCAHLNFRKKTAVCLSRLEGGPPPPFPFPRPRGRRNSLYPRCLCPLSFENLTCSKVFSFLKYVESLKVHSHVRN